MLTQEEIVKNLRKRDERSLQQRMENIDFLQRQLNPPEFFHGGMPAMLAYEEMRFAYANEMYFATVLCAHVFMEYYLGGQLMRRHRTR